MLPVEVIASEASIEAIKEMGFELSYKFPDKYIRIFFSYMYAQSHALSYSGPYQRITIEILRQLVICPTHESRELLLQALKNEEFEKRLKEGG